MTDRTVIVGGGITGLAAAHELFRQGRDFIVLEAEKRVGGKVAGGPVAGSGLPFDVDMGADGFLAREPEMTDLCKELGLGDDLVSPTGGGAFMWVDGALRRIPPSVLGAPLDPESVAASGIVSAAGVADLAERLTADLAPVTTDASVGEVLRPRVGDETFTRLVDPLLGGINAGNADNLSIASGAKALAAAARKGGPFVEALRAHVAAATPGPVFHGIKGGSQRIIDALNDELGEHLESGQKAERLERTDDGWIVHTTSLSVAADHVIITTPGWISAGLLAPHAPEVAAMLAGLAYSDAVLVTFVADTAQIDHELDSAGFLVPRDQGLLMTACSWSSSKWDHYDDGTHAILRVSAGRIDDTRWLEMDETTLVETFRNELGLTMGLKGEAAARVGAFRQALPQYRPGHLERCDQIDEWLGRDAPGVAVAGALMRGLGLPACVRQGRAAATL